MPSRAGPTPRGLSPSPELKTPPWAGATRSLKNLFGTLPGICYGWPKNELHWRGIANSIVDIALTRTPDLAIVDLIMPKIDGLELVRQVRGIPTSRPPYIIILSTMSNTADIVTGLDAGADDYLAKPFDAAELRARVEVGRRMIEMRVALADKVEELALALEQVKTLRGIVPICANCKNVRDDQGYWNRVETYVREHTGAEFSHAVCPDCMSKLYPQFNRRGRASKR